MNGTHNSEGSGYVEVVVDVPAVGDRRFTYSVPGGSFLPYGSKVYVPFGRAKADGYVVGHAQAKPDFEVKEILSVYDQDYLPPASLLSLGEMLKDYYFATTASFWTYLWPPFVSKKQPTPDFLRSPDAITGKVPQAGQLTKAPDEVLFVQGSFSFRWQIYLQAIRKALDSGIGVIVLVPEIRKIAAANGVLQPDCGDSISLVHSEMTAATRRKEWLSLLKGRKSLALGTRSAIFSPVRNLGLIVVDEEESAFYKAEEYPRYNAVTVARLRGQLDNCKVLLGSFVPSVRTRHLIGTGELKAVKEPSRTQADVGLQTVSLLGKPRRLLISKELHLSLKRTFDSGERALLFLNRRGTSSSLVCTDCGNTIKCPRCSVSLAYHSKGPELVCHTCGYRQPAPSECPLCHGYTWKAVGYGIDRAASEFKKRFPGIPVLQLDQDSKVPPEQVIEEFASCSPSCLLSTQMVLGFSKIPPVATLGVLTCDNLLSFPDYRSPEEVFRLLMGLLHLLKTSGGDLRKEFIVQTLNPEHHGIQGVSSPDSFYATESENRKALQYPPFGALFKIEFSGKKQDRVIDVSESFADKAQEHPGGISVLGPSPAPKPKVRGQYRWHIMLKAASRDILGDVVRSVLREISPDTHVRVSIDSEEPFGIS